MSFKDSKGESTMAANQLVQTRIDSTIKEEAGAVLAAMGLTVLRCVAQDKALPFEPLIPNATTIQAMKDARAGKTPDCTGQFKRDYKREKKRQHRATLDADLYSVLSALLAGPPLNPHHRDHALTGNWKDHRDCHVKPDLVLIYPKPNADTLRLAEYLSRLVGRTKPTGIALLMSMERLEELLKECITGDTVEPEVWGYLYGRLDQREHVMGTSYEQDVVAWANEQSALLRAGKLSALDIEHIAEEIEDVGKSEQRELANRMAVLLAHLLKWQHQSGRQGSSWQRTIKEQRRAIEIVLRKTPSLKNSLTDPEWITGVWADSVSKAAEETGLDVFPEICPWSMGQALDLAFFPEQ
ncbi:hypothetical protein DFQ28_003370 [Apophysomyces sp. BC1034]|nr:hypothetical protein DFQ30_001775 [Apophysomyces sp. BC1015]KAG0189481.1 hypothetical protein DFQ28_003370 [Apophysomyces sp. BC1034]